MKNLFLLLSLLFVIVCFESNAQCAMCKATIESNQDLVGRANGINMGILYLMCIPYIIGGVIAYFWYKNSRNEKNIA